MYSNYGKRAIDFLLSFCLLALFSPILLSLTIMFWVTNKGTPFFLQTRPGLKTDLFKIIKFKTMRDFNPTRDEDIHSPKRITKLGAFVRKYSLDELLQLINVLKGDMSLVGPRPLLVEYVPLYNTSQKRRHDVRPGITGWAQVNGRNALSWKEKFDLDVYYVDHMSFIFDIKILFLTIVKVFHKEGVNKDNDTIMPVWKGN